METYILKFSACLAIFWLVYVLVLERLTIHRFKRFYLLAAFAISLTIPTLTITEYIEPVVNDFEVAPTFIPIEAELIELPVEKAPLLTVEAALWLVYLLGVLLFSIRFTVNLYRLSRRISKNTKHKKQRLIYVLLTEYRIPHSFFKYIFVNKQRFEEQNIPKEVILHEETHAKQLHSLDVLLAELLQIIFWFHPLIYILKHHIKLNHEFLADQAVLNQGTDTKSYQNILLQFSSSAQDYQLASAINYSSIKKRFTVMKTQTSKTRIWLSSLLLLPIIAILFYSFAEREYVEKDNSAIVEAVNEELKKANDLQLTYTDGATPEMMQEYNDWVAKLNDSNHYIYLSKYERMVTIYELMTDAQRNSVEPYTTLPEINLSKVEPKKPTKTQFESWKNEKEFALWLDGKPIKNADLNSLSVTDIEYFTGSFVHDNARSDKYQQSYQFQLFTKEGFKKAYLEFDIRKYQSLTESYSKTIKEYLQGIATDHSELKILKAQVDKLYKSFTKKEIENYNLLPPPPVPARKNKVYARSIDLKILNDNSYLIDGIKATKKTFVKVFNQLHNDITPETRNKVMNIHVSSSKDISNKEVWFIYNLLQDYGFYRIVTPNQEINRAKGNTPFAIESSVSKQQKATKKQISEYNAWAKKIHVKSKVLSDDATFFPPINEQDLIKFSKIYKRMTPQQKNQSVEYPFPGLDVKTSQQEATKKQIAEYNAWAKKMNMAIKKAETSKNKGHYPIIKKKDYNKYYNIYSNLMTEVQRENAEAWPNIPPPPPPPPPAPERPKVKKGSDEIPPPPPPPSKSAQFKNGKKKTLNEIIEETPKTVESGFEMLENGESHYFTVYKGEKTYYNSDGYITDETGEILPPPPPAPESTLDFVIRMAKANAKFFNEGKSITSDEAIALIKKNDKLNINAKEKGENGEPMVYITKKPIVIEIKEKSKN